MKLLVVLPLLVLAGLATSQDVIRTTDLKKEFAQGIAESTDRYIPQIQDRVLIQLKNPENPLIRGVTDPGGPNNLPVGGLLKEPRGKFISRFPGVTFTGWNPPDPMIACGPADLVVTVNSSMSFFTKTGTKTLQVPFETFFSSLNPGPFLFNPKVIYDVHAKRFVVVLLEKDDATSTSKLLLAVSDDSNPAGTWFKYRIEAGATVGGTSRWADYPSLGYMKGRYIVSMNMVSFTPSSLAGVQFMLIDANTLAAGEAVVQRWTDTSAYAFNVQVAENTNPTSVTVEALSAVTTSSFRGWEFEHGTESIIWVRPFIPVPTYKFPPGSGAPSPGGRFLDELDGRLSNAVQRGTSLVTSHAVVSRTDGRIRVRWYEWNAPGRWGGGMWGLIQTGEVKETSAANVHYFMPSISMSATGDIAMVMSKSGSAGPVADIVRTARSKWAPFGSIIGEPLGTMGAPVVLKSSGGPTYGTPGFNRWGNYSAVCVDPADNGTFWVIHMTGDAGSNWTTEISSFGVSPVLTSVTLPATVKGTFSVDWIDGSFTTNVAARQPNVGSNWEFGQVTSSNPSLIGYGSAAVATGNTTGNIRLKLTGTVYAPTVVTITVTLNGVSVSKDITVVPADPVLSLSVSTVAANQSVIGRVLLSAPAGAGGQIVNLTSSDPVAVLGPTAIEWEHHSITIPAGQWIGKFGISTANALSTRTSDITATWGSTSLTKTLTVIPSPALSSLKIAGTKVVVGGESTTCVVRILTAAPDGGARVKLLETSDAVVPDIFANINAGQNSGTATIRTTPVTRTEIVVITARMNGTNKTDTLTVTTQAVGDLTLSVPTVAANQSAIGTVTLLGIAGPSGQIVNLTSSDPIAVLGPTALEWEHHSITIPAGARTGKFGISTASTSTIKTSEITATLGTTSVTRTLTVIPSPGLSSLVIAGAKTVVGGQSTTCVVQVLAAAPDGGARVKLLESSDFVTPDIFANIPAGLNTGSATIKTSPVTTTQVVVIIARLNGVTKTDTLTVTP